MGERVHPSGSSDQSRDVLRGMAWRGDQADRWRDKSALRRAARKRVAIVDGPVIVHACVREQRRIQRVIWVMVRKHDVGDIVRINGKSLERLKDLTPVIHHAGVNDYRRGTVSHEADRGLDCSR